jgi:hypothetical protein
MMLAHDWKDILKKAWSIRLMILAGLLSGVEVVLPLFMHDLPRGLFAVLSMMTISAAFITRLMAQRNMRDDE